MEYYADIKKKSEVLPFATWMDLESIMLSQTEKDKHHRASLSKPNQTKLIDTENSFVVTKGLRSGWAKCVKGINCMVTDGNLDL